MTNLNNFVGIDISKEFFDIYFEYCGQPLSMRLSNNSKGFKLLLKKLSVANYCVMEATGPYYLPLACFLVGNGIKVSVVNPLVIKRYSQMRMIRTKTDKADARMIMEYASQNELNLWEAPQKYMIELQQLEALSDIHTKTRTALTNQLKAFQASGMMDEQTGSFITAELEHLDDKLKMLENRMLTLTKEYHGEMFNNLTSIPGLGKKTAIGLIVLSGGFKKFENYRQLSSYIGLCPRVFESGKTVKGKGRICKIGMSRIRAMLYMCTLSAKKTNLSCKNLYERLVAKGKPKMVALIAIANKLIKQAFAIGVRGIKYDPNYNVEKSIS